MREQGTQDTASTDIHFALQQYFSRFIIIMDFLLEDLAIGYSHGICETTGVDTGAGWRWRVIVRHVDKTGKYKVNICSSSPFSPLFLSPTWLPALKWSKRPKYQLCRSWKGKEMFF